MKLTFSVKFETLSHQFHESKMDKVGLNANQKTFLNSLNSFVIPFSDVSREGRSWWNKRLTTSFFFDNYEMKTVFLNLSYVKASLGCLHQKICMPDLLPSVQTKFVRVTRSATNVTQCFFKKFWGTSQLQQTFLLGTKVCVGNLEKCQVTFKFCIF